MVSTYFTQVIANFTKYHYSFISWCGTNFTPNCMLLYFTNLEYNSWLQLKFIFPRHNQTFFVWKSWIVFGIDHYQLMFPFCTYVPNTLLSAEKSHNLVSWELKVTFLLIKFKTSLYALGIVVMDLRESCKIMSMSKFTQKGKIDPP